MKFMSRSYFFLACLQIASPCVLKWLWCWVTPLGYMSERSPEPSGNYQTSLGISGGRRSRLLCGKKPDHFLMNLEDIKLLPSYLPLPREVGILHVRIGHKEQTLPSTLHLMGFIRESESLPLYVYVLMNAVSMEARRGHQILWTWSYRRLVTMWVLGTDPGACTRTVNVLNFWAIPLAHFLLFYSISELSACI